VLHALSKHFHQEINACLVPCGTISPANSTELLNLEEQRMKMLNLTNKLITAASAVVCVGALATTLAVNPSSHAKQALAQTIAGCDTNRSVQVSGSATVEVVPDEVFIRLGIQIKDNTAEAAQGKVATASQNVIKALKALGVNEKKISSDYFYAQPTYDNYETRNINGFIVNYTMGVLITDARKASDVISAAFKAGANEVQTVEFRTSQARKFRDEARVAAMTAAAEKAQLLAKAGGAEVGCTLKIDEISAGAPISFYRQNVAQNAVLNAGLSQGESSELPLNLGTIPVKAEVVVSYSLK
jgi:hypothetical protein